MKSNQRISSAYIAMLIVDNRAVLITRITDSMPAGAKTIRQIRQSLALASQFGLQQLVKILVLNTTSALLQTVGFFSIMPFLYLATNPDLPTATIPAKILDTLLGSTSWPHNVIYAGVSFVILTAIAHIVSLLTAFKTELYQSEVMRDLRMSVFTSHLNLDYPEFARLDHAKIEKLLHEDIDIYMDDVLDPALDITTEVLFLLFLLAGLLFLAPGVTLIILTLLVAYFYMAHLLLGNVLEKGSVKIDQLFTELYKTIREALSNLRYIYIHGAANYHTSQLSKTSHELAVIGPRLELLSLLPKPVVEILISAIVVAVVSFALIQGDSLTTLIPLIGSIVYALYRIMPSMQSIFENISSIRTYAHVSTNISKALAVSQSIAGVNPSSPRNTPGNELVLESISFKHRNNQPLLENVSLSVRRGQHIGIVGESGSGKTTILDILLLLQPVASGSIYNDGFKLAPEDGVAWRQHVGYVSQQVVLSDATVADNIAYGLPTEQRDYHLMRISARTANILDFIENELEEQFDTRIGENGMQLSGGQKQRIGLARALYRQPHILVLDEATSALDLSTEKSILHRLRKNHPMMSVIFVAHRASSLATCETTYCLNKGLLTQSPKDH